MKQSSIFVTHRFVGYHRWADAPDRRSYLTERHRHLFHVRVDVDVTHDDREVEFHDLLDVVTDACEGLGQKARGVGRDLGSMSCETIALYVVEKVLARWPGRTLACEVSEDGEAGGRVAFAEGE